MKADYFESNDSGNAEVLITESALETATIVRRGSPQSFACAEDESAQDRVSFTMTNDELWIADSGRPLTTEDFQGLYDRGECGKTSCFGLCTRGQLSPPVRGRFEGS
jgi:hypothetical protein